MSNSIYARLAGVNLKKNRKLYLPYIISSIITIAMYYVMNSVYTNKGLLKMQGSSDLQLIIFLGCVIIAIFSCIFLIYTNSFLIKQRKKEFGLYSVLGMEKRHVGRIIFFESIYSFLLSIIGGLVAGIIFDKLTTLILCKILRFEVVLGFHVSKQSLIITTVIFACIFLLNLIINVVKVGKSNPIDLLHGSNTGEKEPKTKIVSAVLGLILLITGYTIAIVVKKPLDAIMLFFVAVLCVIFGTYLVFMAGSIALLKLLRKNKTYYYNKKHFNSVSGMLYRMKQNAVGLANICILSTMVLVMISTTVSLYAGTENSVNSRYPFDMEITSYSTDITDNAFEYFDSATKKAAADNNVKITDYRAIRYVSVATIEKDGKFISATNNYADSANITEQVFLTEDSYYKIMGKKLNLTGNNVAVYSFNNFDGDTFDFLGKDYHVQTHIDEMEDISYFGAVIYDVNYIILKDEAQFNEVFELQKQAYGEGLSSIQNVVTFNIDGTEEEKLEYGTKIGGTLSKMLTDDEDNNFTYSLQSKQDNRKGFYELYGSLLFLGIVLGLLFLIVTIMIIYYKQISEGYDDRERFQIMQKVGMSREEVKKSIHSQVLTVFFLPLITACIHLAFSFPIISKLMVLLQLTNTSVFLVGLIITAAVFAVIYTIVYSVTAKIYYKIVS